MERDFQPELIFVTDDAARDEVTSQVIAQYPRAKVRPVKGVRDIQRPRRGLKEGIDWGKGVLVISRSRSAKFVEHFENDDPGAVCPTFHKVTPATHCPFDCQFCFLQGTYRMAWPWICVYTNMSEMLRQIDDEAAHHDGLRQGKRDPGMVFNSGELCDSLGTLGIVPGLVPKLAEYFAGLGDHKLLLLTKSAKVDDLLHLSHNRNTIIAWSLNCERATRTIELGTASLDERVMAARACQEAGYPIRFRFDPLLYLRDWEQQYADMVERALKIVQPERITLGSYRLLGNLDRTIAARFPDSELLGQELERHGKRLRYPHEVRREMYEFVIQHIRQWDDSVPIAVCKETSRMWSDLRRHLTSRVCNCLP